MAADRGVRAARPRGSRAADAALLVTVLAAPALATCGLLAWLFGATLLDYFPAVSDELAYYQQIATFAAAGFGGGYFTFDERAAPAAFSRFGVHGPAFPVAYGTLGRLIGWTYTSGPIVNLAVLAAATAAFAALTRPTRRQLLLAGAAISTSWWVLLMASITMQETLNQAGFVIVAGLVAPILQGHPGARRAAQLAAALVLLVALSILRPTNWVVAPALALAVWADRPRRALAAFAAGGLATGGFWLLWRYLSAPIPSLAIELDRLRGAGVALTLARGALDQAARNWTGIFDVRVFVADPFYQHVMFEAAALAAVTGLLAGVALVRSRIRPAGMRPSGEIAFRVDAFVGVTLALALTAFLFFYFDSEASISRVTAPFLLLALLVMTATGVRGPVVVGLVAANLLVAPSFVERYRDWRSELFTYDRRPLERFRADVAPFVTFDPGRGGWCNTLLTTVYPREIVAVPPGIGLSVARDPGSIDAPVKSKYLLLDGDAAAAYERMARLRRLTATAFGNLYLNLDAPCG